MGAGLNIWIAKPGSACQVDDEEWRITVSDAHNKIYEWAGNVYADLPAPNAHWASAMPPGTYVIRAVNEKTGARTDRAIAVVTCDAVTCVRLYVGAPDRGDPALPTRCKIAIKEVRGIGKRILNSIQVSGTAVKCKKIELTVTCTSGENRTTTTTVAVKADGSWDVNVDVSGLACYCGKRVSVIARCLEDANCVDRFDTDKLNC